MPEDPQRPEQPEGGPPEEAAPEDVAESAAAQPGDEESAPGDEETPQAAGEEGAPGDEETPQAAGEEGAPGDEETPQAAGEEGAPGDEETAQAVEEESVPGDEEAAPAPEEVAAGEAAPGPEIGGVEELAQAARPEAAEGEGPGDDAEAAEGEEPGADAEAPEDAPGIERAERPRPSRRRRQDQRSEEEIIPGAHLEPDLVLEEQQRPPEEGEYGDYSAYADAETAVEEPEAPEEAPAEPEPVARRPLDLAADARYQATGKRKSAVARVILKPGEGSYRINERHLDEYFPRVRLQRLARQPLEAAGYQSRMDVLVRVHGGGVSAQAMAVRHGIARALVEADPALRGELKRRGYLTRDPRVKERKKAGLKKARKRPQFSKR
jgi:small subunit ribosomal protein S9